MKKTFILTENHIKLLRRFRVGWQDAEFGAPEIDPKRPYANSDVENDIHFILTGEKVGSTFSTRGKLTQEERHEYKKLHSETEIALQIVLSTGQFKAGNYELNGYDINWKEI